ncbi:hypothetical protein DESC_720166 [Desulfosarcina cetonica]|nr:hypothetical protein DESC_720166 [Desulfosarcina cetonica]
MRLLQGHGWRFLAATPPSCVDRAISVALSTNEGKYGGQIVSAGQIAKEKNDATPRPENRQPVVEIHAVGNPEAAPGTPETARGHGLGQVIGHLKALDQKRDQKRRIMAQCPPSRLEDDAPGLLGVDHGPGLAAHQRYELQGGGHDEGHGIGQAGVHQAVAEVFRPGGREKHEEHRGHGHKSGGGGQPGVKIGRPGRHAAEKRRHGNQHDQPAQIGLHLPQDDDQQHQHAPGTRQPPRLAGQGDQRAVGQGQQQFGARIKPFHGPPAMPAIRKTGRWVPARPGASGGRRP